MRPKLRNLEPRWVLAGGERRLWLRDPLALSNAVVLVPAALVPLLASLDGTRDLRAVAFRYELQTGFALPLGAVERIVRELDLALALEGPRLQWALRHATAAYRRLPFRPPALAGQSYPADPEALDALFAGWVEAAAAAPEVPPLAALAPAGAAAGVLSPHIDYARGGPVYAATWRAAIPAAATAEVVVVFGTDHCGSAGRLTATEQRYATPWGVLPTDVAGVRRLAAAAGEVHVFGEELHHRGEHSIELAAVWLHWALRRAGRAAAPPAIIPVLCGSFYRYVQGGLPGEAPAVDWPGRPAPRTGGGAAAPRPLGPVAGPGTPAAAGAAGGAAEAPEAEPALAAAAAALAGALAGRRALVVAAADLAHVGPAFGDAAPLADAEKAALAHADAALLAAAAAGDAGGILEQLRGEQDRRRVCGLPPTFWALRLLERLNGRPVRGRLAGYAQCPADDTAGSVVTIAGMLWEP